MRFSFIRTGFVATAAAVALAACGGHAFVPSQSAAPGADGLIADAANPCYTSAVQPAWIFTGACKITKLPPKGETIKLAAYKTIKSQVTGLPKNNGKSKGFVLVDAVGGSDIMKYKGKAFPPFPAAIGKSAAYVEAINGFAGLKFSTGNLTLSTTLTKLPGKTCAISLLKASGKSFKWTKLPIPPTVKGTTVSLSIPAADVGIFFNTGLPAGPLYFNVSCK